MRWSIIIALLFGVSSWSCTRPFSHPSHCTNGMRDEDETARDCGGSCIGCTSGQHCERDSDCMSKSCTKGRCDEPPSCKNGLQDGEETDVDCGGPYCSPCERGKNCLESRDCDTWYCAGGICDWGPC